MKLRIKEHADSHCLFAAKATNKLCIVWVTCNPYSASVSTTTLYRDCDYIVVENTNNEEIMRFRQSPSLDEFRLPRLVYANKKTSDEAVHLGCVLPHHGCAN
jgi:hypothetical protein